MAYAGQPLQSLGSHSQHPRSNEEDLLLLCEARDSSSPNGDIRNCAKRKQLYSIVAAGFLTATALLWTGAVRPYQAIESEGHLPTVTNYAPSQGLMNGQWYWNGQKFGIIIRGRYLVLDARACHIAFNASRSVNVNRSARTHDLDASIIRKKGDCNSPLKLEPIIGQQNTFSCASNFGGGGGTFNNEGNTIVLEDGLVLNAFKGDVGGETGALNGSDELTELAALVEKDKRTYVDWSSTEIQQVGFIVDQSGKCLTLLDTSVAGNANFEAVMTDCDWASFGDGQRWVLDGQHITIRSAMVSNRCLQASGFSTLAVVGSARCKPFSAGQIWTLSDSGIMATLQSVGKTNVTWCATPSSASGAPGVQQAHDQLVLTTCASKIPGVWQSLKWQFADMDEIALRNGLASHRPLKALIAESNRREDARAEKLLTLDDVAWVADSTHFLNHTFWFTVRGILKSMTPDWGKWQNLFSLWKKLGKSEPELAPVASAILANLLSNMVFAGTNFVHGSNGKNLNIWGTYRLYLRRFTSLPLTCGTGKSCTWQIPNYSETVNITSIADFASDLPVAKELLGDAAFGKLYTGKNALASESHAGQDGAFKQVAAGVAAARKAGLEPSAVAASSTGRFAFDLEGILFMLNEGFGWYDLDKARYAFNGAFGASLVEQHFAMNRNSSGDVLGFIMTESALSMHLAPLGSNKSLLHVNLTALERYKPLPGFARLGGQAVFALEDGKLKTTLLEYGGHTYTNFSDPRSDADFAKSKLSGWRFAEKAIIASLLAKTQLLTHIKLIHMELAPVLQAVTSDLPASVGHHIKLLLEPFIQRSIQATNNNIKAWFEFRAGEFGLAPLSMEEQSKLLSDVLSQHPSNLSDLDMENYAQVRGMQQHANMQGRRLGNNAWQWKWHHRALQVQRKYEAMIRNWIRNSYAGNDASLQADAGLRLWWVNMFKHMPALRAAAKGSWFPNASVTTGSSAPETTENPFGGERLSSMRVSIPMVPDIFIPPLTTIRVATTRSTTTTTTTIQTNGNGLWVPVSNLKQQIAPVTSNTKNGYTSIVSLPQPGFSAVRRMQPTAEGEVASSSTETSQTVSVVAAEGTNPSVETSMAATNEVSRSFDNASAAASTMAGSATASAAASTATITVLTTMAASQAASVTASTDVTTTMPTSTIASTNGSTPLPLNESGNGVDEENAQEGVNTSKGPETIDDLDKSSARNDTLPELSDNKAATNNDSAQVNASAANGSVGSNLIPIPEGVPDLGVEALVRVLRTLLVWVSWVHEDVGHAAAAFVYNPVHTPGFVPSNGEGIPIAALAFRVAAFRNFVALERPKLLDRASDMLFLNHTACSNNADGVGTSCQHEISGTEVLSFKLFQHDMRQLKKSDATFRTCGEHGWQHSFFSCTDDVESSASS